MFKSTFGRRRGESGRTKYSLLLSLYSWGGKSVSIVPRRRTPQLKVHFFFVTYFLYKDSKVKVVDLRSFAVVTPNSPHYRDHNRGYRHPLRVREHGSRSSHLYGGLEARLRQRPSSTHPGRRRRSCGPKGRYEERRRREEVKGAGEESGPVGCEGRVGKVYPT